MSIIMFTLYYIMLSMHGGLIFKSWWSFQFENSTHAKKEKKSGYLKGSLYLLSDHNNKQQTYQFTSIIVCCWNFMNMKTPPRVSNIHPYRFVAHITYSFAVVPHLRRQATRDTLRKQGVPDLIRRDHFI